MDDREQIVEVVGDPAGQLTDRLEPLRSLQLFPELVLLALGLEVLVQSGDFDPLRRLPLLGQLARSALVLEPVPDRHVADVQDVAADAAVMQTVRGHDLAPSVTAAGVRQAHLERP